LYGVAARGCLHRGDGPDARQRTIATNRQRLGVLRDEDTRRYRWVHIFGRRRYALMAAKKAAKKPAKKAAKKSAKKR